MPIPISTSGHTGTKSICLASTSVMKEQRFVFTIVTNTITNKTAAYTQIHCVHGRNCLFIICKEGQLEFCQKFYPTIRVCSIIDLPASKNTI